MKIEIEIKLTGTGYTYTMGEEEERAFVSMEAAARCATEAIIRKCYSKMTDIPQSGIDIHTQITLTGSEFQDADECSHHYLAEEKP